ncbi:MAG: hypothetical protein M5U33_09340 [Pseudorhodoplanes sp.]|nr:hypothetical protein [Pseudorhodoplanes sp.]
MPVNPVANASAVTVGTLCGVAAALCWAMGFTVAKYGLAHGMTAPDLALHRFAWSGLLMLPLLARQDWAISAASAGGAASRSCCWPVRRRLISPMSASRWCRSAMAR